MAGRHFKEDNASIPSPADDAGGSARAEGSSPVSPDSTEAFMMAQAKSSPRGEGRTSESVDDDFTGFDFNDSVDWSSDVPQTIPYVNDNEVIRVRHKRRKKRGRKIALVIVLILVVLLGAAGAATGYTLYQDAKSVKDDAYAILDEADDALAAIKSGDGETLLAIATDIDERAGRMHETTSGVLWNIAALVPVYGEDVQSVQTLAALLDELSESCITPICTDLAGTSLSALFSDGTINIDLITLLVDDLLTCQADIDAACTTIANLPAAHISQLATALEKVQPYASSAQELVNALCEVAPVLPQLLGSEGTRTYVVIAQNNSEIRATGGYPGSIGTVTITNGVIEVGAFGSVSQILGSDGVTTVLTEADQDQTIFSTSYAYTAQLVTTNPDFTSSGQHLLELWEGHTGTTVDGVIAIDPVFLQNMLSLVGGSITLANGTTFDSTNAATILLNTIYATVEDTDLQDELFAEAAKAAAALIMGSLGNADLSDLLDVISTGAEEGRLQVYMKDETEEAAMAALGMDGGLSYDETTPVVGIYFNDNTWAKISYYLSSSTTVSEGTANADGTTTYTVTTTLKNNLTEELANSVNTYITGYNTEKETTGTMITQVFLYAPAGGTISDISVSTGEAFAEGHYSSLQVWVSTDQIHLEPQEECVISYTVTVSAAATEALSVYTTPTAQEIAGW